MNCYDQLSIADDQKTGFALLPWAMNDNSSRRVYGQPQGDVTTVDFQPRPFITADARFDRNYFLIGFHILKIFCLGRNIARKIKTCLRLMTYGPAMPFSVVNTARNATL